MAKRSPLFTMAALLALPMTSAVAQDDGYDIACPAQAAMAIKQAPARAVFLTSGTPAVCRADGQPNAGELDCDRLFVVVRPTINGCTAAFTYSSLKVRHGKQKHSSVTWEIFGPRGYRFDAADGISLSKGIAKPGKPPPEDVDKNWDSRQAGASGRTFTIKTKKKEIGENGQVCHQMLVRDPSGNPCVAIDPVIANEPS